LRPARFFSSLREPGNGRRSRVHPQELSRVRVAFPRLPRRPELPTPGLGGHLSGRSRQPLLCRSLSSGNARFVFGNEEWRLPPPTPAQTSRGICALRTRAIVANLLRTPRTARGL